MPSGSSAASRRKRRCRTSTTSSPTSTQRIQPWATSPGAVPSLGERNCSTACARHISRYMVMGEHELVVTTLYVALTWVFDAVDTCGYLRVVSPVRRCGKSRLLTILSGLVRNPLPSGGMSESALFRSLGREAEDGSRGRNREGAGGRGEGPKLGRPARVPQRIRARVAGAARRWRGHESDGAVDFDVYGPKVLGGTGQLDDQILDRSWVVNLVRKKSADKVARYRRREAAREATELRQQLEAWAASVEEAFADARPDIPNELDDRGQDIAEPLLALADLAGDEWPAKARAAVVALRGGEVEDDALGVQLLADIRAVWPGEAESRDDAPTPDPALRGRDEPLASRVGREPPRDGRRGRRQAEPRSRDEAREGAEAVRGQAAEHRSRAGEGVHPGRFRGRVFSLPPFYTPRGRTGRTFRSTKPKTGLSRLLSR